MSAKRSAWKSMPPLMKRLPVYAAILAGILGYQWWRGQQPKAILIEVGAGAGVIVQGAPVAPDALPAALKAAREQFPNLPLVVRADPALPAGAVLPVIEAARVAGVGDLEFETVSKR